LLADIYAHKSGHALHAKAVQFLVDNADEYLEEFQPDLSDVALSMALNHMMPAAGIANYA
jgi:hypothetical protein